MKIQSNSRLFRWAYLGEVRRPDVTDLCSMFWRVVLFSPAKILVVVFACSVVILGLLNALFWVPGMIFYRGMTILGTIWIAVECLLLLTLWDAIRAEKDSDHDVTTVVTLTSLFRNAKRMAKGAKLCPIVYVERGQ